MLTKNNKLDFSNQQFYLGIDVHLKQWKVTILAENCVVKTFSQPSDSEVLINHLRKNYPGATFSCAYEAGFSGFGLYYDLREQGVDCMIVNPADIPVKDSEKKKKTDALDSRKIAKCLRAGILEPIYVPSWETIGLRNVLRCRQRFIGQRTCIKNRIKHFLYFNNISIPIAFSGNRWNKEFIDWLTGLKFQTPSNAFCMRSFLSMLGSLEQEIKTCTTKLDQLSDHEPLAAKIQLLKTIPGIGKLSALTLIAEIDDIHRFGSLDKLCNYVGLVPQMHQSGESQYAGRLTIRGNKKLKSILIESSWIAIKKDPTMLMTFNKLCNRMKKNQAIVRIAKKMLSRVRFVLLHQQAYRMAVN